MRKFVVYSRKGPTSILEVEVELITALEDPSIMWALQPGEFRARILKPILFHQKIEKEVEGKKEVTLVPDVWYSHSFYETLEDAHAAAAKLARSSFEFELRKYGKAYTEEDIQAEVSTIKIVML